jgi:hypothetical protein
MSSGNDGNAVDFNDDIDDNVWTLFLFAVNIYETKVIFFILLYLKAQRNAFYLPSCTAFGRKLWSLQGLSSRLLDNIALKTPGL